MFKVLFSSAGRRVGLIHCFRQAAKEYGIEMNIFAADMEPEWSPACQIADHVLKTCRCTDESFYLQILEFCQKHTINMVIPTIDTELIGYAIHKKLFQDSGITVVVPDLDFVSMARDKFKTMHFLQKIGVDIPETWTLQQQHRFVYPLIAKPVDGSCSAGICYLNSKADMKNIDTQKYCYLFQKICLGEEYTINCYYEDGRFCCAVPHHRIKVRAGEVLFGETIDIPCLNSIAEKIASSSKNLDGVICFQAFYDHKTGSTQVIEINARFGGGYPLCDYAGGKYALWLIQKYFNGNSQAQNQWKTGARMLRYDSAVFYSPGK